MGLPINTLKADTAQISAWKHCGAYDYEREFRGRDFDFWEWLKTHLYWPGDISNHTEECIWTMVGWSCAIALIVGLSWWIYKNRKRLKFNAKPQDQDKLLGEEDNIYGVNFEKSLHLALEQGNFRNAMRIVYLQTLRFLADNEIIDWQLFKTPTQYTYEFRSPQFHDLTNIFIIIRYGNIAATKEDYIRAKDLQQSILDTPQPDAHTKEGGEHEDK